MAYSSKKKDTKVGEIWRCFEGEKPRPILIIDQDMTGVDLDVNIARVTTAKPRNDFDIEIKYWKEAGLDFSSVVRSTKISTVRKHDLMHKIGKLHPDDLENVLNKIIERFSRAKEFASDK